VSRAHESARSTPATRWRCVGLAAAHRPKAPSTCSHAPLSAAMASRSSKAPVLISPAGAQMIVAMSLAAIASRRRGNLHPAGTVGGTRRQRSLADAQEPQGAVNACVSSAPTSTRMGGNPVQAEFFDIPAGLLQDVVSGRGQAGRRAVWQPRTKANEACRGSPSSCRSQAPATSSATDAAGPRA
jgi:hypothetical protein